MQAGAKRVYAIDEIRGLSILLMVLYHAVYDVVYIFGVNFPFFSSPFMNVLRDIFAGLFILISGVACQYSRNNIKRGFLCFMLGIVISIVSYLVSPSQFIAFGILHFLGCAMLLYGLIEPLLNRLPRVFMMVLLAVLFVFCYGVPNWYVGIPGLWEIPLPAQLFSWKYGFPFGFPNGGFFSADYFPLIPWLFLFLLGSYIGRYIKEERFPKWFYASHVPFLGAVGRHTIWIYLAHQPVVYGILWVFFHLIGQ
jgi:uncharacterized membrane protein